MFNFKQMGVAAAIALGFVVSTNAVAADATFTVKIAITASCDFGSSVTDVDFGTRASTFTNAVDATGGLNVTCTNGTTFHVGLNNGLNAVAPSTQRNMKLGSNLIPYGLFTDNGRTSAWTDLNGSGSYTGVGTGGSVSIPVYGRVPANSLNVPAGNYSDTVTATISY